MTTNNLDENNLNKDDLAMEDHDPSMMPSSNKKNWLYVYAIIGLIGIAGLILIAIYRERPKKSAPVEKRKVPATRTVFTSVIAPVDAATARHIVEDVTKTIGADSGVTQMTISGTAVYKRCTSLKDFQNLFYDALTQAQPENLKRQAMLLSHVSGVITSDNLPTNLFIVGRIAEENFAPEEKRLTGFAQVIGMRNESLAPVTITAYIPAANGIGATRSAFLNTLKRGKYAVIEHPMAW
jgi:hypothetical protein